MANLVPWFLEKVKTINNVIWHTSLSDISKSKYFLIRQLRIILLSARGFMNDKVQIRAASLTFYTIISIIPIAAIAFAIAKGFNLDQDLEKIIDDKFSAYQDLLTPLIDKAKDAIAETRGGYLAGIGMIILFWSVMSLLNQIESSFNHIWQITSARAWFRKFTDYLTIMLIAPIFLILSSSITVFVSTQLSEFMSQAPILDFFKPLVSFLVKFAPYLLSWIALTGIFIIMPNTKVKFMPALVSGIIIGTILQFVQWLYIDLQFGIAKLSTIYGSFAAIPLFMMWIQISWTIVLLGAELSFANQNISRYELESDALNVSNFQKRALVLMIMNMIVRNFSVGEKPVSAENIAGNLKIPVRLARDILQDLHNGDLVSVIQEDEHNERLYQPALDINKLSVSFVLNRLDKKGAEHQIIIKSREYSNVIAMLDKFDKLIARSDSNILVKDL